jgi:hypothetical protein
VLSDIPIFIRAGHIVAMLSMTDEKNISTFDINLMPLHLVVGLFCNKRNNCKADGILLSTHLELIFNSTENQINITLNYESENHLKHFCNEQSEFKKNVTHARIYGLTNINEKSKNVDLNLNLCLLNSTSSVSFAY